jgi:hypothetical protein
MPHCWICGAPADSAEHMVKASDFRSVFGKVTQKAPAYRHSRHEPNVPVRGAQAENLKFAPSLCGFCNNTRTQPHDRAWQKLSESIRAARPPLVAGSRVPLQRIFPGSIRQSMLNVHLYFVKLLGCYAVEYKVPLPIVHFGLCIQNSLPHPSIRIILVHIASGSTRYEIQVGHINAMNLGGKTVSASWFYIVGNLGVAISYNEAGHPRLTRDRGWHPNDVGSQIRMASAQ